MKRILYILCFSITLASCGTTNKMFYNKGNVAISLKKDYVTCYFEKDSIAFQLSSLWANFTNNPYPVITGQTAGSYDAWISLIKLLYAIDS